MVGSIPRRDLLCSPDCITWEMVNQETPYEPYSPVTVHNNRIVAVGKATWETDDGRNWTRMTETGDPRPLASESPILSFGERLMIVYENGVYLRKGNAWRFVAAPWGDRVSLGAAIWNDRLFVVGGAGRYSSDTPETGYPQYTTLNDVWSTADPSDPTAWVLHTRSAPWLPRMWPCLLAHEGWLYLTSGYDNTLARNLSDTWRTSDGRTWHHVFVREEYPARHAPTLFSRGNEIYLVAGNTNVDGSVQNDVWALGL